jgi:hypothetical protein
VSITANVTASTITASVSGGSVAASVSASTVTASASGGVGPQGPAGAATSTLGELSDVQLSAVGTGDVLRRDGTKWKNYPDSSLVDGGNFG